MKKKVKAPGKKVVVKSSELKSGAEVSASSQKVMVGEDEFCPTCMEWRSFDELTGRCKVCGHIIKKKGEARKITDEFDLKDFSNEHEEPSESGEF
jgi:hypothetical protein